VLQHSAINSSEIYNQRVNIIMQYICHLQRSINNTEAISPERTYKTGPMSVWPCGVNIIKNLRLRDHWADVNDTWHVYSTGPGKNFQEAQFQIMTPCCAGASQTYPSRFLPFHIQHFAAADMLLASCTATRDFTSRKSQWNSQHHIGESSSIGRDDPAEWLII